MGNKIKASLSRYISIESTSNLVEDNIKTDFSFRTGNFVWRVKFNTPLDATTVTNTNLYVTNSDGLSIRSDIHYLSESNEIEIETLDAYDANKTYTLHITTKVQSRGGRKLKEPIEVKFHL